MRKRDKKLIRVIAIALAVLLAGGVIFSAVVGALAEARPRDRMELTIEYLEAEQALHVTQRLSYLNRTPDVLDAVVFCAAGNLFRRQSALEELYDDPQAVFPSGYRPGGIDLQAARFDGADADYGFMDDKEIYLRVGCALEPGQSGLFEFDYYLLLSECRAFQGVWETDVRLGAFAFVPGVYDPVYGEFIVNQPLAFTRWLYTAAADYACTLTLPSNYIPAATGTQAMESDDGALARWRIEAENTREFALSFGKRWRAEERTLDSGVRLRALSRERGANRRLLDLAQRAVEQCEAWFGAFPVEELEIAQSDLPDGALNYPGAIWVASDLLAVSHAEALAKQLRFCVAQQYFGLSAYPQPSADAWLSDSVSEYVACLMLEDEKGHDAFLSAINRDWVDALQLTIPGGLVVSSDARLFDAQSYDVVVRIRGAVVMHELRVAMGKEALLEGLRRFYETGRSADVLTEMDFVAAMDAASGRSWEAFLTDWVFNVGDYVNQTIDWFE